MVITLQDLAEERKDVQSVLLSRRAQAGKTSLWGEGTILPGRQVEGIFLGDAEYSLLFDAWLIKTQRQILGFNLKTRKTKLPVTGSYLDLSLKIVILPPGNLRMRLRAVSSRFIILSSSEIKGVQHYSLVSMAS